MPNPVDRDLPADELEPHLIHQSREPTFEEQVQECLIYLRVQAELLKRETEKVPGQFGFSNEKLRHLAADLGREIVRSKDLVPVTEEEDTMLAKRDYIAEDQI